MRLLVAVDPVDFRCGIDGLAKICRTILKTDPFSGYVFVFRNKRKTSIKILCYDGQGYWICQKRLSQGRFNYWVENGNEKLKALAAHELQLMIWNGDIKSIKMAPLWKEINS